MSYGVGLGWWQRRRRVASSEGVDMMRKCIYCGGGFHSATAEFCRDCYYSGEALRDAFADLIEQLNETTGLGFYATHTGGGCFAIVAHPSDETHSYEGITIYITKAPDVFAFGDTPKDCEDCGYIVGVYDTCGDTLAFSDVDDDWKTNIRTFDAVVAEVQRLAEVAGIV